MTLIKNYHLVQEFEDNLIRKTPVDFKQNLRLHRAMYDEAVAFGVFPLKDPLEDIEVKITIAKVVNSV